MRSVGATPPPSAAMLAKTTILIDRVDGGIPTMRPYREVEIARLANFTASGCPPGNVVPRDAAPGRMDAAVRGCRRPRHLKLPARTERSISWRHRHPTYGSRQRRGGVGANQDGLPDSTASVAVFPSDPKRLDRLRLTAARHRHGASSANGTYEIRGLPSGDYWIVAVDDVVLAEWHSPHCSTR